MTTETNETTETRRTARPVPWRREALIATLVAALGSLLFAIAATAEMYLHAYPMAVVLWVASVFYAYGAGAASAMLPRRRDRR